MPGFFSANALHNDHSPGIGELIEVKFELFCAIWGKDSSGLVGLTAFSREVIPARVNKTHQNRKIETRYQSETRPEHHSATERTKHQKLPDFSA